MALHVVRNGLDIPISGRASGEPVTLPLPDVVGYAPAELRGLTPKLAAREGDLVQAGAPLFFDKTHPEMKVLSPVPGRVREIRRGPRRVITDVIVERSGEGEVARRAWDPGALEGIGRDAAIAGLLEGGLWPLLRERPLGLVPSPGTTPQSILIGGLETGPLQPGVDVLLGRDQVETFQAGVHVLRSLTAGPVFLAIGAGTTHPAFANVKGVEAHFFQGPHPAGDPAVQVNLVDPPRGQGRVFTVRAWDVALVGRLFLEGRFPTERVYAAVGTGVREPRFVRTVLGAPVRHVVGSVVDEPVRWIRGSVLTGETVSADGWAGFLSRAVHVLPETVERELMGWTTPQLGRFSYHRAFLSGFFRPRRTFDLRPGLWGGERAILPIGAYRGVVATPDIEVEFLFKSILAGDVEESVQLGLLDLSEEEAALCTYVCPSKIAFDVLLREGIEQYLREA